MEHWASFLYQFGVGGVLFGFIIWVGIRKKVLRLAHRPDRRILAAMVAAYLGYLMFQGIWTYLAIASRT